MIHDNPSDEVLRTADVIVLFDRTCRWHNVVIASTGAGNTPQDFLVVDIPVDSTDAAAVQGWCTRVRNARK